MFGHVLFPCGKKGSVVATQKLVVLIFLLTAAGCSPSSTVDASKPGKNDERSTSINASDPKEGESFLASFVIGDYVVVGKKPDNGLAYSGFARVERKGEGVVLFRRVGASKTEAEGSVEVPSPPGEGRVLRFRWQEHGPMSMTCLVDSDLDNYPRLTCYWVKEGMKHIEPGLETMFPTAAWPDDAPSKSFKE